MILRIGYFCGTDPMVLTRLAAEGIGTIPLSNGWDDHGKYVAHVTPADGFSAIIGPFHKVMAAPGDPVCPRDILSPAIDAGIPIILVAPFDVQEKARALLGKREVKLIMPEDLWDEMKQLLGL